MSAAVVFDRFPAAWLPLSVWLLDGAPERPSGVTLRREEGRRQERERNPPATIAVQRRTGPRVFTQEQKQAIDYAANRVAWQFERGMKPRERDARDELREELRQDLAIVTLEAKTVQPGKLRAYLLTAGMNRTKEKRGAESKNRAKLEHWSGLDAVPPYNGDWHPDPAAWYVEPKRYVRGAGIENVTEDVTIFVIEERARLGIGKKRSPKICLQDEIAAGRREPSAPPTALCGPWAELVEDYLDAYETPAVSS